MENLTHSLIGATLAEVALPKGATPAQRTLFYATGIIAANLPDADLLYTSIAPAPLGYLLHHRGHTHTVVGIAALAALIGIVTLLPSLRRIVRACEPRYGILVLAALASHLIADSWNSYGVHPFWPLSNRWFYGDAIYILEPWLWMLLGVSVAMNTRADRGRLLLAALLIAVPIAAAWIGLIAMGTLIPIGVVAALFLIVFRNRPAPTRAWASLVAAALFVGVSFGARHAVRAAAEADGREHTTRRIVDVVLNPRPGNPLCWTALSIEESGDSLYYRHGVIGLARSLLPAQACGPAVHDAWEPGPVESLAQLRVAMHADCRVRAWLQFGRAPVLDGDAIADLRFGGTGRGNFTAMTVAGRGAASDCPAHLTDWDLPRADVLAAGSTALPFPISTSRSTSNRHTLEVVQTPPRDLRLDTAALRRLSQPLVIPFRR